MSKSTTVIRQANGHEIKVELYPILKEAISYGWEPLAFAANEETFAILEVGNKLYELVTCGDVEIEDVENKQMLNDWTEGDLKELVKSKEIYDEAKYNILQKNCFYVHEYVNTDSNSPDKYEANLDDGEFGFFEYPTNDEEFISAFIACCTGWDEEELAG